MGMDAVAHISKIVGKLVIQLWLPDNALRKVEFLNQPV